MGNQDAETWPARLPAAVGFLAVTFLLGGLGLWGATTQIAGAVVAAGVVEIDADRQIVQHPDGGVVGEIFARDGDIVRSGDLLLRLDGTFHRSELQIIDRQLFELAARQSRLAAERDGLATLEFTIPQELTHLDRDWVSEQVNGQRALFTVRLMSARTTRLQLVEQKSQIRAQIQGLKAQQTALETELALVRTELGDQNALLQRGLVRVERVNALSRDRAQIAGEIARLSAAIGEAGARSAGLDLEILRLSDQRREQAITRLRDLRYTEIELAQRSGTLHEELRRLDLRAPVDGVVFGAQVMARQSVLRPADPIMFIVPSEQPHQISARINPVHIDQVRKGQVATIRFTSFDQRMTPEVTGNVTRISADVLTDGTSGMRYYEAVIKPNITNNPTFDMPQILPGMPVEVFLETQNRTPVSYLTKPLTDYFRRAFRSD